jgi:DUF177 domain-containing protein
MKIHLKQIPSEGLHLKGEDTCPLADLEGEDFQCAGPLRYDLEVGVSNGALWASGRLKQPMKLRCVSCLEAFAYTIEVPSFAVHTELAGPEIVDLTPNIREDLLLNLPPHPHCDREGGRVCKAKHAAAAKGDAKRKPDWSALDKLKLKNG